MGHAELTNLKTGQDSLRERADARQLSLDEYWMPFTPNRDWKHDPKMIVRAEGMYCWSDRGTKIIDASSGLFCCAAGHGRREIADAVGRQLRELDFCAPFLRGHPKQFELATRLAELTPGDLNRIFFVNSGSEAIDTAMKVALAYHQARGQSGLRQPFGRGPAEDDAGRRGGVRGFARLGDHGGRAPRRLCGQPGARVDDVVGGDPVVGLPLSDGGR